MSVLLNLSSKTPQLIPSSSFRIIFWFLIVGVSDVAESNRRLRVQSLEGLPLPYGTIFVVLQHLIYLYYVVFKSIGL